VGALTVAKLRIHLGIVFSIALLGLPAQCLFAVSCNVVQHHAPTEAEKALLAGDFGKAASLYQTGLAGHRGDAELTAGLVHALLRQQKVTEGADQVRASLAVAPSSAALITLRGEVEFRQGTPWIAAQSAAESDKVDPCNPRNHLLLADIARMSSLYATSHDQLDLAHRLDPADPDIRGEWLHTLSLQKRIEETEAYLSAPTGNDPEETRHWQMYLESLKKMAAEPHKPCHLVSATESAEIPFVEILRDATHRRAFGLEVGLNGHKSRLEIDTGAGGLLVGRSVAEHAGLKPFSEAEMSGIGDKGYKPGYSAYADSIRIGGLEFQNCQVRVLDSRSVLDDVDGLIGMDVFSNFLVTLDFPMRKLMLGPLPPRPEEAPAAPALKTGEGEHEDPEATSEASAKTDEDKPADKAAKPGGPAEAQSSASPAPPKTASHGPYNRYVAPEMKSYTPVFRVGHNILLPAAINGGKHKLFILDTGSWTTIISFEAAREVTKVHSDDRLQVHGISGQVAKVYIADDVTFQFAQMAQKTQEVVCIDTSKISKNMNVEISGFLGATTLELLTVRIDYRDGLVKFDYDPHRGYQF
jgi:predicted aspartyl protease